MPDDAFHKSALAEFARAKAPEFIARFHRPKGRCFYPKIICETRSKKLALVALLLAATCIQLGCRQQWEPAGIVTVLIESSPTNLDPRIGVDAQSERIDSLIFDSLVRKDEHFNPTPWLATSWETPDPLTWVFHLRNDVHFHDGRLLTSADVKYTLDSILQGKIVSVKANAYQTIDRVDAPDAQTLVVHLKKPDPALLWNLSDGGFGVVPAGSGRDFWKHPIGSGPYEFVSQEQDKDVVLRRAPHSWQPLPSIPTLRFAVVPDATTRALELEKGSADATINALPADTVYALRRDSNLQIDSGPGTTLVYLTFNTRDPVLRDPRVRNAIALAINRPLIIHSLYRDEARLAESILPPEHWAWNGNVAQHNYDPAAANALLDEAGYPRKADGYRFHIGMKTSTDEGSRLLAMVVQQQLANVGIALDVRSFEFATFYADISRGVFQMAPSRWIGGNEAPDIFRYSFATASFPPHGANRGFYANTRVDQLLSEAASTSDRAKQQTAYDEVQSILAKDMPTINLWYLDTVLVHSRRLGNLHLSPSGNYDFLRGAILKE
ncbi:ABC transporter substrate-binding protein [Alloacidobacterium sp.]|uniref:ABC transporter substrate-binding protein n=1 Tax=Alloacidobacterium sp. TaxID=2951999 RepID=UPI002D3EF538|nr:ABC transporter substrate-binding protein [Alloacidobacterium sp.]HYK36461.1 ABC transporter substrate-binding protein [Alloacidobacterium sp.]